MKLKDFILSSLGDKKKSFAKKKKVLPEISFFAVRGENSFLPFFLTRISVEKVQLDLQTKEGKLEEFFSVSFSF
jgi:hypothetical protein